MHNPKLISAVSLRARQHIAKALAVGALSLVAAGAAQADVALPGKGKTITTGSLGNVMKESVTAAITYIRSVAEHYEIENTFYKDKDIHIHFPAHQVLFHLTGQLHLGLVVERRRRQVLIVDLDSDGAGVVLELVLVVVVDLLGHEALQHHWGVIGSVVGSGNSGDRLSAGAGIGRSQCGGAEQRGEDQGEVTCFHEDRVLFRFRWDQISDVR